MEAANTNWCQSAAAVVVRDGKVLLARHTYGPGTGKLIIPGGYLEQGELPSDAAKREVYEETGVEAAVGEILGIRFSTKDWYVIFRAEYLGGEARPDQDENDEVVWMDMEEALTREDVPGLTKTAIECVLKADERLAILPIPYEANSLRGPNSLYGITDRLEPR